MFLRRDLTDEAEAERGFSSVGGTTANPSTQLAADSVVTPLTGEWGRPGVARSLRRRRPRLHVRPQPTNSPLAQRGHHRTVVTRWCFQQRAQTQVRRPFDQAPDMPEDGNALVVRSEQRHDAYEIRDVLGTCSRRTTTTDEDEVCGIGKGQRTFRPRMGL